MSTERFAASLITALQDELENGREFIANALINREPLYVIVNDELLLWSNKDGFTDVDFDFFSEAEKADLNLPMSGCWMTVEDAKEKLSSDQEERPVVGM
jgi:hypothetical protein